MVQYTKKAARTLPCCYLGCDKPGEYPAPIYKDFEQSDAPPPRQWFCLAHIREFNKSWDFFESMSPDEINDFHTAFIRGESVKEFGKRHHFHAQEELFRQASQWRDGDEWFDGSTQQDTNESVSDDVCQAMRILGVSFPLDKETVKQSYYRLAKQYHPDRIGSDALSKEHEKTLKNINHAYNLIKDHLKRYDFA